MDSGVNRGTSPQDKRIGWSLDKVTFELRPEAWEGREKTLDSRRGGEGKEPGRGIEKLQRKGHGPGGEGMAGFMKEAELSLEA